MPTYEYRCRECRHQFELFQSMRDAPKRKCPECGRMGLERLIGAGAAVLFKGSGFYQTDYRSESYRKAAEKEKKAAKDGGGGGNGEKPSGEKKDSSASSSGAGAKPASSSKTDSD